MKHLPGFSIILIKHIVCICKNCFSSEIYCTVNSPHSAAKCRNFCYISPSKKSCLMHHQSCFIQGCWNCFSRNLGQIPSFSPLSDIYFEISNPLHFFGHFSGVFSWCVTTCVSGSRILSHCSIKYHKTTNLQLNTYIIYSLILIGLPFETIYIYLLDLSYMPTYFTSYQ